MWSIKLIGRSFWKHSGANCCRTQKQWAGIFSSPRLSVNGKSIVYPNEQIKNLEDFEKFVSPEEKELFQTVQSEYQSFCRTGRFDTYVNLPDQDWLRLMNLGSAKARQRKMKKFYVRQKKKIDQAAKGRERKERKDLITNNTSFYKFIRKPTEKMLIRSRVAQAMMFEDPIVIDLGFTDSLLLYSEIKRVATQIQSLITSINASAFEPSPTLNVILCNVKPSVEENEVIKILRRRYFFTDAEIKDLPLTLVTEKSYLELFPREDLVYITRDAKKYYHPGEDGIPIIGGIADHKHSDSCNLVFEKAIKDDIKIRKLPFEFPGTRKRRLRLPLNQVVNYVAKLNFTCDPVQANSVLLTEKEKTDSNMEDNGHG